MDLSTIALQGLQQADNQLQDAAGKIAANGTNSPGGNVDSVDLSAAVVELLSAKNQFSANVATLKTADEVQQNLLDVTA
jgi:flagellar hook protein FlgE